jgi:uncharacterized Fe-S cluster protein YjdI
MMGAIIFRRKTDICLHQGPCVGTYYFQIKLKPWQ